MHMNTYFYTYIIYLYTLYHMIYNTYPGISINTSTTSPDLAHIHTSIHREKGGQEYHMTTSPPHTQIHTYTHHITSHHITYTQRTR